MGTMTFAKDEGGKKAVSSIGIYPNKLIHVSVDSFRVMTIQVVLYVFSNGAALFHVIVSHLYCL